MGWKVGQWPVHLLATRGSELCTKLAILVDSDLAFESGERKKPGWLPDHDPSVVEAFVSHPTLEPSITEGNELLIAEALREVGLDEENVTARTVYELFRSAKKGKDKEPDIKAGRGSSKKGEFALALAGLLSEANEASLGEAAAPPKVPEHMQRLFDFLYPSDPAEEGTAREGMDPFETLVEPDWLMADSGWDADDLPITDTEDFFWPDDEGGLEWADEMACEPDPTASEADAPPWDALQPQRPPLGAWPTAALRVTDYE